MAFLECRCRSIRNTYLSSNPHLVNCTILLILVVGIYLKVTGHEFLINWDDVDYITTNDDIQGFTLQHVKNVFTKYYAGNYAPVHLMSYMVDYSVWGMNPAAFKMTNVILHASCTLTFYLLLVRLGLTIPQAFLASALFAVHPVQVESVAWASQRKNPLSLLFFLASWHSWLTWKNDESRNRGLWYAGSLILFTLALLSKSVAVLLPFFLLAQELILDRQPFARKMLTTKIPYIVLAVACLVVTLASQKGEGGGLVAYHGGSFGLTMMNMLPVFSRYLILLVFPFGLTFIYNSPLKTFPDLSIFLSGMVLILFTITWLRLRKPHPVHFFWLTLFVVALLPVSNILPLVTMMNDRYLYYPMLGIAPFAVLSLKAAAERFKMPFLPIPAIVALALIGVLSAASWRQVDIWKNSLTLWADALSKAREGTWYESTRNTNFIREGYVESLVVDATRRKTEGNREAAKRDCLLALTYEPANYDALGLLSVLYIEGNKPLMARPYLVRLVKTRSSSDAAHSLLGLSYFMTDEIAKAKEQFKIARDINPQNTLAATNLKEIEEGRRFRP
jgi:4-amino-4-deoxy-L-arabinose transferase-like glycosyltransferase